MTSDNKYIIFFDLETTGLDFKNDRIIQIGMIKTDKQFNVINIVEQKINPCGIKSQPDAFEKHKITDEELIYYPDFSTVADTILEFMKNCDLGGHNIVKFDIPFLMAEMNRCGKVFSIEKRSIYDTKIMDNHYNYRDLEHIYLDYFGKVEIPCTAHDAICDAQLSADICKAMVSKHNPTQTELDTINGNFTRIDIAGFFVFNDKMQVCIGKGKYAGKQIELVNSSYFLWMIEQDLPTETINLAKRCYKYVTSH